MDLTALPHPLLFLPLLADPQAVCSLVTYSSCHCVLGHTTTVPFSTRPGPSGISPVSCMKPQLLDYLHEILLKASLPLFLSGNGMTTAGL